MMAAYVALIPLKSHIEGFLEHYDACFDPPSLELAQYLYKEVISFQEFVERLDTRSRQMMNASLARSTETISKFGALLSSHLTGQYFIAQGQRDQIILGREGEDEEGSSGDQSNQMTHLIDLSHLKSDIHSFTETLKKVKEEYKEEEEDESSSRIDLRGNKSKMVGLSDLHAQLKENIVADWDLPVKLLSIVGMAGIGKTTLAKKIYEDLDIVERFDCRAWVAVGREWQLQKSIRGILAQVNPNCADMKDDDDERISDYLKESLKGKRYLIVLDDVWDVQVWFGIHYHTSTRKYEDGSIVLLTTRMQQVVDPAGLESGIASLDMRPLNKEESWDLLREKVFTAEPCSFKLEKVGRRIAEKCEGLPLTIVTVADLLSKAEKTVEYSTFENVPFVHGSFPTK